MDWDKIPQVFQISVLNFIFDKDAKKSVNHYVLRNDEGRTISNTLNVIFMELPKIKKLDEDISRLTKAQMWGKFFLCASIPEKADYVRRLTEANGGIKMAFTVLKNVSQDELNWYHETRYWMSVSDEVTRINAAKREGLAEGEQIGIAKGEHKKAVEAAQNLLKKGIDSGIIAECTGLPLEEVQNLTED